MSRLQIIAVVLSCFAYILFGCFYAKRLSWANPWIGSIRLQLAILFWPIDFLLATIALFFWCK